MAVNRLFWNGGEGYDVHVVAGATSRRLDTSLVINHGAPAVNVFANAPPANVTVRFRAAFNGVLAAPLFEGFGVHVNRDTGTVAVDSPLPAAHLWNFLIHAEVTDNTVAPARLFVQKIRVHVHPAVTRAWLTPDPLTIYRGAHGQRFSILAEFTDQTVGDISSLAGLAWVSAVPADIAVDAATGALTAVVDGRAVDITVTLPAAFGGTAWTARANSRAPWSTPRTAKLVVGSAGAARIGEVPNFLFAADGFTLGEQALFEAKAQDFITFLRTSKAARPYDLVASEMNFWTVWLDSRERGTSPLYEITPVARAGKTFGREVPQPEPPPAGAAIWTVPQLVHEVGLPVPAQVGVAFATQQAEWTAMFGGGVAAHVDAPVQAAWLQLADRRLVHERDTALGLALGERPRIERVSPPRSISWHPRRTTRAQFEQLLLNLRDAAAAAGPAIGAVWGPGAPGKDRAFVNTVCAGARRGGGRTPEPNDLIAVTLHNSSEVELAPIALTRGFTTVPFAPPASAPLDNKCIVAHENAHALGLGDEYGGALTLPPHEIARVNTRLNLQDETSVAAPVPRVGIDPTLLKWNWPRISKAGVLTGTPAPSGADFVLTLRPGHAALFAKDDVVQLRTRPLTAGIVPSGECRVSVVAAAANTVTVKPNAGVVIVPGSFPAGSIVYAAIRGPGVGPVLVGPPLGLISPTVLAHITASAIPLNIAPIAPNLHVCAHDTRVVQPVPLGNRPLALPPGRPKWSAWIVGAFEGGLSYSCGVFHPTGACMMRQLLLPEASALAEFKVKEFSYRFCPVCRYILVDRIDPAKHGLIDRDYAPRYAEP